MVSENEVLDSMRHIMDPDLGLDIVSLGFVKELRIAEGKVSFTLELTTPACPMKQHFRKACEDAVGALPGVDSVEVTIGARTPQKHAEPAPNTLREVNAVIAVSSCKGGVGKSTVAAHLAMAMRREGLAIGLLDADVYGPSFPTLFNLHRPQLYASGDRLLPVMVDGMKVMSLGFVLGESPAVLRGPIVSNYTAQILTQTDWGKLDYLIIDLPPGTGDIQLTIVQQASLDGAIIVTTPQALSLVDVAKGILMFEKVNVPVLGVVENMCSLLCDSCGAVHHPFGQSQRKLQERFGLPTLAELPIRPGISDLSHPCEADIAVFGDLARSVHMAVGRTRAERPDVPEIKELADEMQIRWADGFEAVLSNHAVRCACPCALCVDEHSGERTLNPDGVPRDIRFTNVQQLGNYAVSFEWTDGHTTGIYSWDYLRMLAGNVAK